MKKLILTILTLTFLSSFSFADPDGNVILIYQLKYVSKIKASETKFLKSSLYTIGDDGKATARKPKFKYFHIIKYNPTDKAFVAEYVIRCENDKKTGISYQKQALGVTYSTYTKVPKDGSSEPHLQYLIGTTLQANGNDVNRGNVCSKMIRGNIPLSERVDVGAAEKVYIPKELTGRCILQTTDGWLLFALYGRLQETYTDKANQSNMTLDEAFDYVSGKLEDQGYGAKLTPSVIDTGQQITVEQF